MQKFGVKIDLSNFFHDERKLVMILVDPAWENVKFLQRRVEEVFAIDRVQFLSNEGCFIPPEEPIEIIKYVEGGLKAFISAQSLKERETQQNTGEEPNCALVEQQMGTKSPVVVKTEGREKKRKYFSLEIGLPICSQNQAKRSKHDEAAHASMVKSNEKSSTSNQQKLNTEHMEIGKKYSKPHKSKRHRKNKVEKNIQNDTLEHPANNTTTSEQSPFSHVDIPSSTPFFTSNQGKHACKENRNCASTKTEKSSNKMKTHINHNECNGDIITTSVHQSESNEQLDETQTETVNSKKITFRCNLTDVSMNKPRIFQAGKSAIDIQEQLIINPAYASTSNKDIANKHEITEKVEPPKIKTIAEEFNTIADDREQQKVLSNSNSSSIIAVDDDETGNESKTGIEQVSQIIDLNETED